MITYAPHDCIAGIHLLLHRNIASSNCRERGYTTVQDVKYGTGSKKTKHVSVLLTQSDLILYSNNKDED